MWKRIRHIIRKEFLQALREPRMRVIIFLPPLIQLIVFGYAVNLDVDMCRIAWVDADRTPASNDLREAFTGSGRFLIEATPASEREVQQSLDRGEVQAVVRVLPGFGRDVAAGRKTSVQVLVDGSNSNTAAIIAGYASTVVASYSQRALQRQQRAALVGPTTVAGGAARALPGSLTARPRVWFNPDLRSRNFYVPGVIINIITIVTLMLTAMAIVREKEIGTMEQLMVTPVRPIELMIGKMLPFALIGLFDIGLITAASLVLFRIPLRGSLLLLFVCGCLFIVATLGIGLLMSTLANTQQQAMMMSFFFFAPAFMLSGFAFPIRNMPLVVRLVTYLNPVRYFIEIVRDIFLKGAGASVFWPQMLALAVLGAAIMTFSAMRFHKRLD